MSRPAIRLPFQELFKIVFGFLQPPDVAVDEPAHIVRTLEIRMQFNLIIYLVQRRVKISADKINPRNLVMRAGNLQVNVQRLFEVVLGLPDVVRAVLTGQAAEIVIADVEKESRVAPVERQGDILKVKLPPNEPSELIVVEVDGRKNATEHNQSNR